MTAGTRAQRPVLLGVVAGAAASAGLALQRAESLPVLAAGAAILTPVPLALAALRGGAPAVLTSFGLMGVLVVGTPLGDGLPVTVFVLWYGGVVWFVWAVARGLLGLNGLVLGAICLAALLAWLDLAVNARRHQRSTAEQYDALVDEYDAWVTETREEAQADERLSDLERDQRDQMLRMLPVGGRLIPAVAVGTFGAWLALVTAASWGIARRLGLAVAWEGSLADWRLPEWLIFAFILPGAGLLLALWAGWDGIVTVTANLLALAVVLYFAQGCAIVHAFGRWLKVHPLVEALAFGAILLTPPLPILLTFAGLFDFQVDFRARWIPQAPATDEPQPPN